MLFHFLKICSDNQFVHTNPSAGRSKLIFTAPFWVGVFRENQFAGSEVNQF